jgi:hypothetical protein
LAFASIARLMGLSVMRSAGICVEIWARVGRLALVGSWHSAKINGVPDKHCVLYRVSG